MSSEHASSSPLAALSAGLADTVASTAGSVVTVYGRRRLPATGILWDTGVIVSASHVVEQDETVSIGLPDGSKVDASVAGRDRGSDIVVLRAETGSAVPFSRDTAAVRVGELALAIGRASLDSPQATLGAVSTVGGAWRTIRGARVGGFVRAELTMLPGFSGGPLVSAGGTLVGMNTSALGRDGGLTIPVAAMEPIVSELLAHGKLRRGYLGIASQVVEISSPVREKLSLDQDRGLLVVHVEPDGPAESAGILMGDVLLGIGGEAVTDTATLQEQLGGDTVDTEQTVQLLRGGEVTEVTVTVGSKA